jgi:hypothetical protein
MRPLRRTVLGAAVLAASLAQQALVAQPAGPQEQAAAAQVLAFERQLEEAVVRGDVAFFDAATAPDFSFVHGDGWTSGGRPLATDDKAAFLRRVANREYLVHDLDGVRVELHDDVAITYGRYVSLFVPPNRDPSVPPRLLSVWFERVYAKRNGRWQFLSHRTVHGPNDAPAGIDSSTRKEP